jgi:hypothetical protein
MGSIAIVSEEIKIADSYYALYRTVPLASGQSLGLTGSVLENVPFTLQYLCDSILRYCKAGDNIAIACHGNNHSVGIRPKLGLWLDCAAIDLIAIPDEFKAQRLGMDKEPYMALYRSLEKVRNLGLGHIALRACRIGQSRRFLKKFAMLLGADSISAPVTKTMYSKPVIYGNEKGATEGKWFRSDYHYYADVPLKEPGLKAVLGTSKIKKSEFKAGLSVDKETTLWKFHKENFPGPITPTVQQINLQETLPIHGLCVPGHPGKYYFPNDPRYLQSLTMVTCLRCIGGPKNILEF